MTNGVALLYHKSDNISSCYNAPSFGLVEVRINGWLYATNLKQENEKYCFSSGKMI